MKIMGKYYVKHALIVNKEGIEEIIQNSLFPSLQFAIGKGKEEMDQREKFRKTLIGIIITLITIGVSVLSFLKK